jgi:1-acyl-sn-glycerol-3-phosphate acyltransferase
MINTIKGLLFFSLFASGCWTSCVILFPTVLLLPIHSKRIIAFRRNLVNFYTGILIDFSAILLNTLCGTKLSLYSDNPNILKEKPLLIISNHRTRIDWMFSGNYI